MFLWVTWVQQFCFVSFSCSTKCNGFLLLIFYSVCIFVIFCVSVNGGTILCYCFISLFYFSYSINSHWLRRNFVLRGVDMLKMGHNNKSYAFYSQVTFTEVCVFCEFCVNWGNALKCMINNVKLINNSIYYYKDLFRTQLDNKIKHPKHLLQSFNKTNKKW